MHVSMQLQNRYERSQFSPRLMYKAVARIAGSSVAVNGDGSENLPKDRMAVASCQGAEHGSNCVGEAGK